MLNGNTGLFIQYHLEPFPFHPSIYKVDLQLLVKVNGCS